MISEGKRVLTDKQIETLDNAFLDIHEIVIVLDEAKKGKRIIRKLDEVQRILDDIVFDQRLSKEKSR